MQNWDCCHTKHEKTPYTDRPTAKRRNLGGGHRNMGSLIYFSEVTLVQQWPHPLHCVILYTSPLYLHNQHKESGQSGSGNRAGFKAAYLVNNSDIQLLDIRDINFSFGWCRESQTQVVNHHSHQSWQQWMHLQCHKKILLQHFSFSLVCHS